MEEYEDAGKAKSIFGAPVDKRIGNRLASFRPYGVSNGKWAGITTPFWGILNQVGSFAAGHVTADEAVHLFLRLRAPPGRAEERSG